MSSHPVKPKLGFLTLAVVVAGTLTTATQAAHDRGVPARAGGHQGAGFKGGKTTQFWRIRAADRRGRAVVAVTIWAAPVRRAHIEVFDPAYPVPQPWHGGSVGATRAAARRGGVALTGASGQSLTLWRTGGTWVMRARSPEVAADIRLTPIAPGARAGPWRFSSKQENGRRPRAWWASPAPMARVRVRVRSEDWTTSFRSRRGYLDRTWGSLDLDQRAWFRWSLAQIWAGRQAFVLPMMSERAEHSGPASADPLTRGVLVKASRRRTTVCRPRVAWRSLAGWDAPALRARCGRTRLVLGMQSRRNEYVLSLGGEQDSYWERSTYFGYRIARPHGAGTIDTLGHRD